MMTDPRQTLARKSVNFRSKVDCCIAVHIVTNIVSVQQFHQEISGPTVRFRLITKNSNVLGNFLGQGFSDFLKD